MSSDDTFNCLYLNIKSLVLPTRDVFPHVRNFCYNIEKRTSPEHVSYVGYPPHLTRYHRSEKKTQFYGAGIITMPVYFCEN